MCVLLITGHRKRVVGLGRGIDLSLWMVPGLYCTLCAVHRSDGQALDCPASASRKELCSLPSHPDPC